MAVPFKVLAAFSLAVMHAGAWAWSTLSENYCAACRRRLSLLSLAAGAVVASVVSFGFWWAISKGLFKRVGG